MVVTESRSADRKKVRFPPLRNWNPEAKWTQDCVMFKECGEKHAPGKCDAFKKLSPQQRLKMIEERELCHLCYRNLQGRECWSKDKVPNCGVDGCQAAHHHLLHGALVQGRVMVVWEISAKKAGVFLCREDVRVRSAGGTSSLHEQPARPLRLGRYGHAGDSRSRCEGGIGEEETGGGGRGRVWRSLHYGRQLLHAAGG